MAGSPYLHQIGEHLRQALALSVEEQFNAAFPITPGFVEAQVLRFEIERLRLALVERVLEVLDGGARADSHRNGKRTASHRVAHEPSGRKT